MGEEREEAEVGTEKTVCQARSSMCSLRGGRAAETLTTSS